MKLVQLRTIQLFAFFLGAFGAPHMARAYDNSAFVAPRDKARIVFIQNQRSDRKMTFTVFESDKRCVAEVGGREAQVLDVFPGPYIFYVLGYNTTRRIELYPEAGRTYFVRLHTVDGLMGPVPDITLVRRTSDEHKRLKFTLDGAIVTHAKDNRKCYARPLKERENRTQRRLNEANAQWKNGDDVYRDKYRLIERDGLTPKDVSLL
jgi:hypothetical protein